MRWNGAQHSESKQRAFAPCLFGHTMRRAAATLQLLELGGHWRHTTLQCCLLDQLATALSLLGENRAQKQVRPCSPRPAGAAEQLQ